jgi:hypothetical protein
MKVTNMSHGIDYGYFGCFLGLGSLILDGTMLLEFYIGWSIFFILRGEAAVHDGLGLYHLDPAIRRCL